MNKTTKTLVQNGNGDEKKMVVIYNHPNTNLYFSNEIYSIAEKKKEGDRISIALHYKNKGVNNELISFGQLKYAIANCARNNLYIVIEKQPREDDQMSSTRVILQKTTKERWEQLYTLKEYKEKDTGDKEKKQTKYELLANAVKSYAQALYKDSEHRYDTVADSLLAILNDSASDDLE